jgi:aflatoxin B1 aldehyde reductase
LLLGKFGAPKKFIIQTKAPAFGPGAMGKQNILDGMKKSLEDLGTESVCLVKFSEMRVTD